MYEIYTTDQFDKSFNKLDDLIQRQIGDVIEQLETNPYSGKPLGYKFFREKKIKNHRIYYLIYDDIVVVFVIAISGKKDQQTTIDKIKKMVPYYQEEIKKKLNL
tara:strand:+ start:49181 stop:49492 length:312 start_codon:yes stop_codon:yes gene_type:complete